MLCRSHLFRPKKILVSANRRIKYLRKFNILVMTMFARSKESNLAKITVRVDLLRKVRSFIPTRITQVTGLNCLIKSSTCGLIEHSVPPLYDLQIMSVVSIPD